MKDWHDAPLEQQKRAGKPRAMPSKKRPAKVQLRLKKGRKACLVFKPDLANGGIGKDEIRVISSFLENDIKALMRSSQA